MCFTMNESREYIGTWNNVHFEGEFHFGGGSALETLEGNSTLEGFRFGGGSALEVVPKLSYVICTNFFLHM